MNMKNGDFYATLISRFKEVVRQNNLLEKKVIVKGRVLSNIEAIGLPGRQDFPLLTGKESLMEAIFLGSRGQAFTDMPGNFSGSLNEMLEGTFETNYERAVLVATINAVLRFLGVSEKTIHCKNDEPELCAAKLEEYIKQNHGDVKIALVGYQPSMLEKLAENFEVRNLDLDADKINTIKFGVKIEDGIKQLEEVKNWCDIMLVTGSTIVNGTLVNYLTEKPVYFYGTTISGPAFLMNLKRFCAYGS